ncbi:MAG TPA: metallophosphoesterase family protein [Longimicrobiales bacterium]
MNLLQISDVHFGPFYVPKVGEALLRAVGDLEFDVTIISGDFTQRAKREQFAEARAFLDQLPKRPTIVTPGNHDVPLYRVFERVFNPYGLYKQYISQELDMVLRTPEAVIVALNSTKPLQAIVNGRISRGQLEFASKALRETPEDVLKIVVAHHHFAPAPDYEGGQVMPKAKRAIDCFTDLKVDMVIGGHLHRAYIGNSLDVYPGEDRDHGIIIVQSGTTTSRRGRAREREKNSFNHIRVAEGVVRITHYMYFSDQDAFAPVSRHLFPRAGTHYLRDAVGVS